jgi:hypothetical protein
MQAQCGLEMIESTQKRRKKSMKSVMKRALALMMTLALAFTMIPITSATAATKPKLSKSTATVIAGESLTLSVKNAAKSATVKWSSSKKSIATVSKKGKVTGVKAGKSTITAKVTSKGKTNSLKCKVTVTGTKTVATASQLKTALKNTKLTKVYLKTSSSGTFTIPAGTHSSTALVVNAPNADVVNNAVFKSIKIKAIKSDTFTENAIGNKINITAAKARVVVSASAKPAQIAISTAKSDVAIIANGAVGNIVVDAAATVNLSGTATDSIPVAVSASAKDATITSSVSVAVTAAADANITLEKGAEGSTVAASTSSAAVIVKNGTTEKVDVTTPSGTQSVAAGQTQTISESTNTESTIPANAVIAEVGYVASIDNDKTYDTLAAAIEAANASEAESVTIRLAKNATISEQQAIKRSKVNIIGNGYTIFADSEGWKSDVTDKNKYMIVAWADDVNIENVTLDGNNKTAPAGLQYYRASGTINNVTVKDTKKLGLTINASDVTATGYVKLVNTGSCLIDVGIGTGSDITSKKSSFNASAAVLTAKAIKVDKDDPNRGDVTITAPEGWIQTTLSDTTKAATYSQYYTNTAEAKVGDVGYEKLTDAITNATAGGTVTLLKDVVISSQIYIDKNLTIEGNKHTIKACDSSVAAWPATDPGKYMMLVWTNADSTTGRANVIIKDLTLDANTNAGFGLQYYNSEGTLSNVTITGAAKLGLCINNSAVKVDGNSTLTVDGDATRSVDVGIGSAWASSQSGASSFDASATGVTLNVTGVRIVEKVTGVGTITLKLPEVYKKDTRTIDTTTQIAYKVLYTKVGTGESTDTTNGTQYTISSQATQEK